MAVDREQWLAERRLGIGGSDVVHLLEVGNEGCRRRLAYDKTGTPPDFPDEETLLMRRGRVLEDAAAGEYELKTGRAVNRRKAVASKQTPWARVNVDRMVRCLTRSGRGVLEIKTHGAYLFRQVKREGLRVAHILQLQHGLFVTGREWGAFAVFHPDSWELLHFDVERDDKLIGAIKSEGDSFWQEFVTASSSITPPAPYEPTHKLCRRCPWRLTCHGLEAVMYAGLDDEERAAPPPLVDGFEEIVGDYLDADQIAKDAAATLELVKSELKRQLEARELEGLQVASGARVYYRPHPRRDIDTKKLRELYPAIVPEVERVTTVRPLRVFGARRKADD